MPNSLKIAICSVSAAALLFVSFRWFSSRAKPDVSYPDRTVQLSNSAFLRIHSTLPELSSDFVWKLSYRANSGWEEVDDWVVEGQMSWYGGNILACPAGKLVVVVRTDGSLVFVRTESVQWKTFHMEIPEQAPFPELGVKGTNFSSLETPEIRKLRSRMSIEDVQGRIFPRLAQFLPDTRELWVDYLNGEDRRFRLRFLLSADGEKLEFMEIQERPFNRAIDTSGPPFFLFQPDKSVPPVCNKIEFFH